MTPTTSELLADLVDETRVVDGMIAALDDAAWEWPTPAEGWWVRDQVSHLAYFDETATLAVTDPDRFRAETETLAGRGERFTDGPSPDRKPSSEATGRPAPPHGDMRG
jgi:hypothetical protein